MPLKDLEKRKAYHREYGKRWYAKNKERHKANVRLSKKAGRLKVRRIILEAKNRPCMDCGGRFAPDVMDFHHRDPATKVRNIGDWASDGPYSVDGLVEEMEKCDLLCSNCHRLRHANGEAG